MRFLGGSRPPSSACTLGFPVRGVGRPSAEAVLRGGFCPARHLPFPVHRAWTSPASQHTCSWGFASFSCSPFRSLRSFTGTRSFITRSPVRSLVSTSTSADSLRVCCHNSTLFQGKLPEKAGGVSHAEYQERQPLGCCVRRMPICLLGLCVLPGALAPRTVPLKLFTECSVMISGKQWPLCTV